MDENIYMKAFALRLSALRQEKQISARDMSISLGQSHNFIHNIESGKNFPTMLNFFYICEFLGISAEQFFQYHRPNSLMVSEITTHLEQLGQEQLNHIAAITKDLCRS